MPCAQAAAAPQAGRAGQGHRDVPAPGSQPQDKGLEANAQLLLSIPITSKAIYTVPPD